MLSRTSFKLEKDKSDFNSILSSSNVELEDNTVLLEGVVSRKKQVVPIMTENA